MRRLSMVGVLGALLGCQQTVRLEGAPEPVLHARAYVWVEAKDGGVQRIHATNTLEPLVLEASTDLYVLTYDCGLPGLYLPQGELRVTTGAEGRPLPLSDGFFRAEPSGDGAVRWIDEVAPAFLRGLRVAVDPSPCPRFDSRLIVLEGSHSTIATALAIGPEEALASTYEGKFYVVSPSAAVQLTDVSTSTPNRAAVLTPSGEVWLLDGEGRLARGQPKGPFVDAGRIPWPVPTNVRAAITATEVDGVLRLYAVSALGAFAVFDGRTWTVLDDGALHVQDEPAVVALPNGEVYAVGQRPGQVLHYADGSLSYERVNGLDVLQADLIHAPLLGVVLATSTGRHYLRGPDGQWSELPGKSPVGLVYVLQPFRAGLLIGGLNGFVASYDPVAGYCPAEQLGSNGVTHIASLADGFLLFGLWQIESMTDQEATASYVKLLDAVPTCSD